MPGARRIAKLSAARTVEAFILAPSDVSTPRAETGSRDMSISSPSSHTRLGTLHAYAHERTRTFLPVCRQTRFQELRDTRRRRDEPLRRNAVLRRGRVVYAK